MKYCPIKARNIGGSAIVDTTGWLLFRIEPLEVAVPTVKAKNN